MEPKILVIDDNTQDRKSIQRILSKAGYNDILMAETAEDGISVVATQKPDLVILDTLLPRTNGFEVCRKIREREGRVTPRIIIMTGSIDAVDALRAREVGADDYCVKTFDYASLMEAVRNILRQLK